VPDIPGPSKTKKTEEVHKVDNASVRTASITLDEGGDGEEVEGIEAEQKKGEVPPPRDEEESLKKRKVSPLKPSSRKKSRTPITKMQTTLTLDDFNFIISSLNDASLLEIVEKQEAKKEQMYNRIEIELQGVQQALQSSHTVSLCLWQWGHQNWEMSQLNFTKLLIRLKLTFDELKKKQRKPPMI
jgi:hypothetical protein